MGWVLPPALRAITDEQQYVVLRCWRVGVLLGLAVLLVATPLFALVHTFNIAQDLSVASVRDVLLGTRLGLALNLRFGLTVLLTIVLMWSDGSAWRHALAFVLGSVLLVFYAVAGHAAAAAAPMLPIVADWLHLLATALWTGGLIQFGLLLSAIGTFAPDTRVTVVARVLERFSPLALASVAVLATTGTYAALRHIGAWHELWTTTYGQTLLVKLAMFGALVALGAYNMLLVRPRFRAWTVRAAQRVVLQRWQQRFTCVLRGEVALVLVVVMATGVLTGLAPAVTQSPQQPVQAAQPGAAAVLPVEPFNQFQAANDLQVQLAVTPTSPGPNRFQVTVTDEVRAEPAVTQLVRLDITKVGQDLGTTQVPLDAVGPGIFGATASALSLSGEWEVTVLMRRAGANDVRATFVVPVGDPAP